MAVPECFAIGYIVDIGVPLDTLQILTPSICNYQCNISYECNAWSFIYTEFDTFATPPTCRLYSGDINMKKLDQSLSTSIMAVSGYSMMQECPLPDVTNVNDEFECGRGALPLLYGPYSRTLFRPTVSLDTVAKRWGHEPTTSCHLCDIGSGYPSCGQESIYEPTTFSDILSWQDAWTGDVLDYVIKPVSMSMSWNCISNEYSLAGAVAIDVNWTDGRGSCQMHCHELPECVAYSYKESKNNTGVICTTYSEYTGLKPGIADFVYSGFKNCNPYIDSGTSILYYEAIVKKFDGDEDGYVDAQQFVDMKVLTKTDIPGVVTIPQFTVSLIGVDVPDLPTDPPIVYDNAVIVCRDSTTDTWRLDSCYVLCDNLDASIVLGFTYRFSVDQIPFHSAVTPWELYIRNACDTSIYQQ